VIITRNSSLKCR